MEILMLLFWAILCVGLLHRFWRDHLRPAKTARCVVRGKHRQPSPFYHKPGVPQGQSYSLLLEVEGRGRTFQVSPFLWDTAEVGKGYSVTWRGGQILRLE